MKIALHPNPNMPHQRKAMAEFAQGAERWGCQTVTVTHTDGVKDADLDVFWGVRYLAAGQAPRRIILEAGYLNGASGDYHDDRRRFYSVSVNEVHGRSEALRSLDGKRWEYLEIEARPWKADGDYLLILGQHPGDAVTGPKYIEWLMRTRETLTSRGVQWMLREHPLIKPNQPPLTEQLVGARAALTWCSTAAVEAVLEGVPVVVFDEGAITWTVASHSLDEPFWRGDRTQWCYDLAYRQWTPEEIATGDTWEWLKNALDSDNRASSGAVHASAGERSP